MARTRSSLILLLLLLPGLALAAEGHITLLTVGDNLEGGGTADLYLTIRQGTGQIFIDSFPLTRLDTQGSTRYANQIACDFLQEDCSRYDFFYTIRAGSTIVGGPSAGAGIAVLTAALLDSQDTADDIAITGTINSGGIIGPVGGIRHKVDGAHAAGLRKVLVPLLAQINGTNASGRGLVPELSGDGIAVVRVGTLEEALEAFTGKRYERDLAPVEPSEEYALLMRDVAGDICSRTEGLRTRTAAQGLVYNDSNNYTQRIGLLSEEQAYSRASLCFSSNIELNRLLLQEYDQDSLADMLAELVGEASSLTATLDSLEISSITDLEVYAIVKERLLEAEILLSGTNLSDISAADVAYAQERLTSAASWSRFFALDSTPVELNDEHLHAACLSKLAEAEERISYVGLYEETLTATARETLRSAYAQAGTEDILCIFTAGKAKAQATLVASALFVDEENVDVLVQEKLRADELVLRKQAEKGFFPLLGYSYTRYAEDLAPYQPYSALTFAEYALELSSLDIYFPKERAWRMPAGAKDGIVLFALGALFGAAVVLFVLRKS